MKVIDVEEDEMDKWELEVFPKLASGAYALVSDNAYLDYYYITKLAKYPNLYRAKHNFMALPYFIAMSQRVTPEFKNHVDTM